MSLWLLWATRTGCQPPQARLVNTVHTARRARREPCCSLPPLHYDICPKMGKHLQSTEVNWWRANMVCRGGGRGLAKHRDGPRQRAKQIVARRVANVSTTERNVFAPHGYLPQICPLENGSCREMYVFNTKSFKPPFDADAWAAVAYSKFVPSYVGWAGWTGQGP